MGKYPPKAGDGLAKLSLASQPLDRDLVSLREQRLERVEGRLARIEDAHPVIASIHGVWHQDIEGGEVMRRVAGKERLICLLADTDIQPEDTRSVEVRRVVEVAVVLGDHRREWHPARSLEVAIGVVDEERVAPRDLRRACLPRPNLDINTLECVRDIATDRSFVHF